MRRSRAWVATAVVMFLCAGLPAHAALTKDQQRCQSTAAKKGRVFFKKALKALSSCHDSILAKKLPETTDCELEPTTMAKLDKAEQKMRDKIAISCPDMVVGGGMDFGGDCLGVTTSSALADCLVARHQSEINNLVDLIYDPDTQGKCSGGSNFNDPCTLDGDCPGAFCAFSDEQRDCTKSMSKILGKLTSKRQSILQKCKKDVAAGKLPQGTNCITTTQTALDAELNDARDGIAFGVADRCANHSADRASRRRQARLLRQRGNRSQWQGRIAPTRSTRNRIPRLHHSDCDRPLGQHIGILCSRAGTTGNQELEQHCQR